MLVPDRLRRELLDRVSSSDSADVRSQAQGPDTDLPLPAGDLFLQQLAKSPSEQTVITQLRSDYPTMLKCTEHAVNMPIPAEDSNDYLPAQQRQDDLVSSCAKRLGLKTGEFSFNNPVDDANGGGFTISMLANDGYTFTLAWEVQGGEAASCTLQAGQPVSKPKHSACVNNTWKA